MKKLLCTVLPIVVGLLSVAPRAEDIDLFLGIPGGSAAPPNVLFIIDNTANWSQSNDDGVPVYEPELEALAAIIEALPVADNGTALVNVGMMMFTETGSPNSNTAGGYVRAAIRPMTESNKALYSAMVAGGVVVDDGQSYDVEGFDENEDKSNNGKAGLSMAEAYRYFDGGPAYAGIQKEKTDYDGNTSGIRTEEICTGKGKKKSCTTETTYSGSQFVWNLEGNALGAFAATRYNSPIPDGFCGGNFIIWVGNGAAQDNRSDTRTATQFLRDAGGDTAPISISPSGSSDNVADEWARFMRASTHEIITFTLDINKRTKGQGPGWTSLLQSMARESDGEYYDVEGNYEDIFAALGNVFSRVLAINSVFASAALPASANAQSTFVNQVYIGQFRPDETAKPRWLGNLKQYRLGRDADQALRLLDAKPEPDTEAVVDSSTGFIAPCVRSYWTPGTTDSYWDYLPANDRRGDCLQIPGSEVSNYPDGPVVEKGGHAYVLRGDALRTMYTCVPSSDGRCAGASPVSFSTGTSGITGDMLDADSSAERSELINWARGLDVDDEDRDGNTGEMRPSAHGDIIHTQPVAIDYANEPFDPNAAPATPVAPDVAVFFGANDGALRAINGNRSGTHEDSTVAAGDEFWSFMPPEFFGRIKRLRDNETNIRFPATGTAAGSGAEGEPKPYGFDGPITAYNAGKGDDKFLYAAMRRGGRALYAFDVSTVESPALKWVFGCPDADDDDGCGDGAGANTDVALIGQTWSEAALVRQEDRAKPLLLMGGGYDGCEDYDDGSAENHQCTSDDKGGAVFLIDGDTGALLQTFPTHSGRAVPGRVTVVPVNDSNPDIAYAYAADTGGNVYRIHAGTSADPAPIGTAAPGNWEMTRIASLGCAEDASCAAPRKFLFGPDVVRDTGSDKLWVLLGSGDREKPLAEYGAALSVQNRFFALIDQPSNGEWFVDACGSGNLICLTDSGFTEVAVADGAGDGSVGQYGWHLPLASGEQVVSGALTIADVVNFSTHVPTTTAEGACETDLGTARTYNLSYKDGSGDTVSLIGGGLAPTPVAGEVILDDGEAVPFCIGCGGERSSIGGSQISGTSSWVQPTSRVYWEIRD